MSKLVDLIKRGAPHLYGLKLSADEAQELLAHIERLEANQLPEGFVVVPKSVWEACLRVTEHASQQIATHKPQSTDSDTKGE